MQLSWTSLDPRLLDLVERFGAGACTSALVFDGQNWVHITASARVRNLDSSRELRVWSAKNQRWEMPNSHGESDFDLRFVALREARRALSLAQDAPLQGGEAIEVRVREVEEYWNTPAHIHFEVVFAFWSEEIEPLPRGARWFALDEKPILKP